MSAPLALWSFPDASIYPAHDTVRLMATGFALGHMAGPPEEGWPIWHSIFAVAHIRFPAFLPYQSPME